MSVFNSVNNSYLLNSHAPLFQYYLTQELKTDIQPTADVAIDDTTIEVTADHGITVGDYTRCPI